MIVYIHALRDEGDLFSHPYFRLPSYFYPRPPRGGRRQYTKSGLSKGGISIHALREEGDLRRPCLPVSRPAFLSTPSARRATQIVRCLGAPLVISIHALREEGDRAYAASTMLPQISIHALREEGDRLHLLHLRVRQDFYPRPPRGGRRLDTISNNSRAKFLSTPSARRATLRHPRCFRRHKISIHALREEGDAARFFTIVVVLNFYPRPPRGGRREHVAHGLAPVSISIHALREEGDRRHPHPAGKGSISIHALREEGDGLSAGLLALRQGFYPRPPRGGRLGGIKPQGGH